MTNPAIQNDFSYYRRTLNRMRINNVPVSIYIKKRSPNLLTYCIALYANAIFFFLFCNASHTIFTVYHCMCICIKAATVYPSFAHLMSSHIRIQNCPLGITETQTATSLGACIEKCNEDMHSHAPEALHIHTPLRHICLGTLNLNLDLPDIFPWDVPRADPRGVELVIPSHSSLLNSVTPLP